MTLDLSEGLRLDGHQHILAVNSTLGFNHGVESWASGHVAARRHACLHAVAILIMPFSASAVNRAAASF